MKTRLVYRILFFSGTLVFLFLYFSYIDSYAADNPFSGYDPSIIYKGPFVFNHVYYKNSPKSSWIRGLEGTFPGVVACADALAHLKTRGVWKGHFNKDGSCGPTSEPVDWAVGNRLNFEKSGGSSY